MAKGGMRALEHPPSVCVSQTCPQAAPSAGAPWYESLGIAENDLQSPAARWVVHRGFGTPDLQEAKALLEELAG